MFTQNILKALKEDKPVIEECWTRSGVMFLETTVRGVKIVIDKEDPSWFFSYNLYVDDVLTKDVSNSDCKQISQLMNAIFSEQTAINGANLLNRASAKLTQKA